MERLIDADKAKDELINAMMGFGQPLSMSDISIIIDKQKTAYDIENVLDKLESNKFEEHDEPWKDRWDEAIEEAIEIVKQGGIS